MSDDSFFREVSEELRQDRIKAIWTRFGTVIVAAIVAIILITAGVVGWQRYAESQANASGDRLLAALDLEREGQTDEAIAAFRALAEDGWGPYPALARMSIANAEAEAGRSEAAVASYEAVAADGDTPQEMRDMADLRAAYVLVDTGSLDDVRAKAERLTGDDSALRYPAREAIGLAAWKAEDVASARDMFRSITEANDAPGGIAGRARLMLELIAAGEPAPAAETDTDAAPDPEAPDPAAEDTAPAAPAASEDAGDAAPAAAAESAGETSSATPDDDTPDDAAPASSPAATDGTQDGPAAATGSAQDRPATE